MSIPNDWMLSSPNLWETTPCLPNINFNQTRKMITKKQTWHASIYLNEPSIAYD